MSSGTDNFERLNKKELTVLLSHETAYGVPMTKDEYFEFHKNFTEEMLRISRAKNSDYTGIGNDPFANFSRVESVGICSTEQGFLTRIMDKICRINSYVQKGSLEVQDESVFDSLKDCANYCILLAGYIQSKKKI